MKGEITLKILEALEQAAVSAADLAGAFLSAGYGASYRGVERELRKEHDARAERVAKEEKEARERQRFSNMLCALKRDELIYIPAKRKKHWALTWKGLQQLKLLRKRATSALPKKTYPRVSGSRLVIVVFDIPERERRKRDWLRGVLGGLGFRMLQKSVWIGKVRIPEELINDLRDFHLVNFVEIFEISRTGSLHQLV